MNGTEDMHSTWLLRNQAIKPMCFIYFPTKTMQSIRINHIFCLFSNCANVLNVNAWTQNKLFCAGWRLVLTHVIIIARIRYGLCNLTNCVIESYRFWFCSLKCLEMLSHRLCACWCINDVDMICILICYGLLFFCWWHLSHFKTNPKKKIVFW